jgi:uncharacterized membrane protein
MNWLSDWDSARRCPGRTLAVTTVAAGGVLGVGHYLISGRSDPVTSVGAGAIAAIVVAALVSSNLWPNRFRTPLRTNRSISIAARFAFPAIALVIAGGLLIAGAIAKSGPLAVSAVPFVGLGLVTLVLRNRHRRTRGGD